MAKQLICTAGDWKDGGPRSALLCGGWSFLSTSAPSPIPVAGTFSNWRVRYESAPGSGKTRTITLQKNGANTDLAISVSDSVQEGSDADAVAFAAGDLAQLVPSDVGITNEQVGAMSAIEWEPDDGESQIYGFARANASLAYFAAIYGDSGGSTDADQSSLIGGDGAVTALAITLGGLGGAPGSGNTRQYHLVLDGVVQDGTGDTIDTRVTIADAATYGSASFELPVTAGQTLSVGYTAAAGSPAGADIGGSIAFVPTTAGQMMFSGRTTLVGNADGDSYFDPVGSAGASTETVRELIGGVSSMQLTGLLVETGAGISTATRRFTVRKNQADTDLSVGMTGATLTGSDVGSAKITSADRWSLERTNSGTPANGTAKWAIVGAVLSSSARNVILGNGHTATGSDTFVTGVGNTVTGDNSQCHGENGTNTSDRSVLFNLDGVEREVTDDDTFHIYGTLKVNGTEIAGGDSTRAITLVVDGGGSVLTTGIKADVYVPFACTISSVTMLADQSGSVVVDIWKDAYANYPPTNADSITASAPPTLSAAAQSQDTTLTGWTTSISAGDTVRFNIDSVSTITRLVLTLTVTV